MKKQIDDLKKLPPAGGAIVAAAPTPYGDINDLSKQEMATKLLSYQQFMAKYIVDAQQEKMKAVQAAELAMRNRYEEKLILLGAAPAPPAAEAVATPSATAEKTVYDERTAKVAAAAKAGKSRWGDKENEKAVQAATPSATPSIPAAAPAVNGLVNGSVAPIDQDLYNKRNSRVAAAGAAGKSRWGEAEIAKATTLSAALPSSPSPAPATPVAAAAAPAVVPPEVEAADHGLRNDGGVGGPSLAERVNLGAQLLGGATAPVPPATQKVTLASASLYDKRNARIAAAGKAGKSRWGQMEIMKAQDLVTALPASSSPGAPALADAPVTPEIAAADHGLRNDGGVAGPSLAERVNFGAAILGQ